MGGPAAPPQLFHPLVEQLDKRLLTVVGVEAVLLLHRHPGQPASLLRDRVAEPGVLLFADE